MRIRITNITRLIVFLTFTIKVIANEMVDKVNKENNLKENSDDLAVDSQRDNVSFKSIYSPPPFPCQSTNTDKLICNLDSSTLAPPGQCDSSACNSAAELTLLNCHPHLTVISKQFILSLCICQSSLRTIRLRNCSISDKTFGQGLEGLRVLDLRGNQVAAFREPELDTLESIYLSGSFN